MEKNKIDNIYLFDEKYKHSEFITRLVGPLPPPNKGLLGGVLKFDEEKSLPDLLKEAIQQSLHSSLNVVAEYRKQDLETSSFIEKTLEFLVPFYKECYYHLTDPHYTMNKANLVIDFIVVCSSLESFGLNPKALKKIGASDLMKKFVEGQNNGLSRTALDDIISSHFPNTNPMNPIFYQGAPTEVISSAASRNLVTAMVRSKYNAAETTKFPVQAQIQHDIPLGKCGEFGRYKGIYSVTSEQANKQTSYFIKNENRIYPVRWDKNKYTWRLIEHERPMGQYYGTPIHYISDNKWVYNTEVLRMRGGGIETEETITKVEETTLNFYAATGTSPPETRLLHKDIFTSNDILTDPAAIADLTKNLKQAKEVAMDIVNNAKQILNDQYFSSRARKLIRIFTSRDNEEGLLIMTKEIKKILKNFNAEKDVKLVDVKDSNTLAQISPYHHSNEQGHYLAINYSGYQKNKTLIFADTQTSKDIKEYYANENFARTLIHEFTHTDYVARATDMAGYIELLGLNGKHDITKLLLKAKLGLPEVRNNADSLTEAIFILGKTKTSELYLNAFLEEYQDWEINIEKRMQELNQHVKSIVADKTQLSWQSTVRSDINRLKEEYNLEMYNQLISKDIDINRFSFDIDPFTLI